MLRNPSRLVHVGAIGPAIKNNNFYQIIGRRYAQTLAQVVGGRHSSVVLSAPTILQPRIRIPSTPSMLFSICIEIVMRKE